MKKIFILLILLISFTFLQAQSHTYNACCRYSKGNVMGDCSCPGCRKDHEDEIKARTIESERKSAEARAEFKIKQEKAQADAKRIEEENKRPREQIVIGIPNSETKVKIETIKINTVVPKKNKSQLKQTQMIAPYRNTFVAYSSKNFFLDKNLDTIFKNQNFSDTYGVSTKNQNGFPDNLGIIVLKERKSYTFNGYNYNHSISDFVDINGNRLLNDNDISDIIHIIDNNFLITYGGSVLYGYDVKNLGISAKFVIYNFKTKESFELLKEQGDNALNTQVYDFFTKSSSNKPDFDFTLNESLNYKAFVISPKPRNRGYRIYYIMSDDKILVQ